MEKSQTIRGVVGSSEKTTWNWAKSTWRLLARGGLEAHLEPCILDRPHIPQEVRHGGVAALVSQILQLPQQPGAGQAGIGLYPLAQIAGERVQ